MRAGTRRVCVGGRHARVETVACVPNAVACVPKAVACASKAFACASGVVACARTWSRAPQRTWRAHRGSSRVHRRLSRSHRMWSRAHQRHSPAHRKSSRSHQKRSRVHRGQSRGHLRPSCMSARSSRACPGTKRSSPLRSQSALRMTRSRPRPTLRDLVAARSSPPAAAIAPDKVTCVCLGSARRLKVVAIRFEDVTSRSFMSRCGQRPARSDRRTPQPDRGEALSRSMPARLSSPMDVPAPFGERLPARSRLSGSRSRHACVAWHILR